MATRQYVYAIVHIRTRKLLVDHAFDQRHKADTWRHVFHSKYGEVIEMQVTK